jgi:hypothetical protein
MRPIVSTLLLGTSVLLGQTAPNQPSLPHWLIPYPGASEATTASSRLVESSYTAAAKPEDVSEHLAKLFATNGLTFVSNFDGFGTSIRASAPECDLLIKIRESSSGTGVKVSCASKEFLAESQAASGAVVVTNSSVNHASYDAGSRSTGSGYHLKSAEEIKRYNEERVREIKAKREAFEREGNARMQQYDQPFYPQSQTQPAPLAPNLTAPAPIAHYRDDAPPLVWLSWLVGVNGEHLSEPTRSSRGPESSLSRKYQTTVPMTELQQFYKRRLEENGFTVRRSFIAAGSTSSHVKQNASGEVEGDRHEGTGMNPPTTTVKVGFNRSYLNEPISVWIAVSVRGSFGR